MIFRHVLEDGSYDVLQSYSDVGHPLRILRNTESIALVFQPDTPAASPRTNAQFMLWVHGSGPAPEISRHAVTMDGRSTWRETCGPMGCVTLGVHIPDENSVFYSTANSVSEGRMGAVEGKFINPVNGDLWDMRLVNAKSAALNRFIRRQAVVKLNTVFILPDALRIWEADGSMGPWSRSKTPNALLRL